MRTLHLMNDKQKHRQATASSCKASGAISDTTVFLLTS